jgi:ComF family protein
MPLPAHPLCPRCGIPFEGAGDDHPCSSCLKNPPPFHAARAALLHGGPGRDLIHAFKYHGRPHLRRPLGLLVVERLTEFVARERPDLIVPVPLHVKRLRSRGFNQALLVGELLAEEWRIPFHCRALRRVRWTEPQINLAAELRRENVRNAFRVPDTSPVEGRRVLLVDDVFTTGSTVEECSRTLLRAGAEEVLVITLSRALP